MASAHQSRPSDRDGPRAGADPGFCSQPPWKSKEEVDLTQLEAPGNQKLL